jgi:hypothetical protein
MATARLSQLLDARLQVLQQLYDLARRQRAAITQHDLSTLLQLLAAKQQVLQVLKQLDSQLEPFRAESPELRRWESEQQHLRAKEQAARGEALLREILALDQESEQHMLAQREEAARDLSHFQQHALAERAYLGAATVAPRGSDVSLEG